MQERKEKLIRILQILQKTDSKSPMNATQIINKLQEFEVGKVDRRAIYSDIAMLQSCGYPIIRCQASRKGWYYGHHIFEDWEIKIMMDAVTQTKFISSKNAKAFKEKMLSLVSERSRYKFAAIKDVMTDYDGEDENAGEYLALILEALYYRKKITFQYTELDSKLNIVLRKEGHEYKLNIYTLCWSENNYYLIGSHDRHNADLVYYRLDRIRNLKISDESVMPAEEALGPNPEIVIKNWVRKSVRHFSGNEIKVVLEYEPNKIINGILYDFVGKDIFIRSVSEKKVQATFKMAESPTLTDWLIQYVDKVKVIEPQSLKNSIIEKLEIGLQKYLE